MADEQKFIEFPKWIYKANESKVVQNQQEQDDAEADGWGLTQGYIAPASKPADTKPKA